MSAGAENTNVEKFPVENSERDLRIDLAAAYRLVDYFGWTELIFGHLTARVPGDKPHFLINPFGLNYDEVTASNLVKIDVDGEIIGASKYPVNRAGFIIHSAIHMAHSNENKCVMHTHTRAGMAMAATKEGLQSVSMTSTEFQDRISYHDFEGLSLYEDERSRLLSSLGNNKAMILRNHGLLVVGRTIPETFLRLYQLERACQIQIDAAAAGTLNILSPATARKSGDDMAQYSENEEGEGTGVLEFSALKRKLNRIDLSYQD